MASRRQESLQRSERLQPRKRGWWCSATLEHGVGHAEDCITCPSARRGFALRMNGAPDKFCDGANHLSRKVC